MPLLKYFARLLPFSQPAIDCPLDIIEIQRNRKFYRILVALGLPFTVAGALMLWPFLIPPANTSPDPSKTIGSLLFLGGLYWSGAIYAALSGATSLSLLDDEFCIDLTESCSRLPDVAQYVSAVNAMGRDLMEGDFHFLGDWVMSASARDRTARSDAARTELSHIGREPGRTAEQP